MVSHLVRSGYDMGRRSDDWGSDRTRSAAHREVEHTTSIAGPGRVMSQGAPWSRGLDALRRAVAQVLLTDLPPGLAPLAVPAGAPRSTTSGSPHRFGMLLSEAATDLRPPDD